MDKKKVRELIFELEKANEIFGAKQFEQNTTHEAVVTIEHYKRMRDVREALFRELGIEDVPLNIIRLDDAVNERE